MNKDEYLQWMKQAIDDSVKEDEKIQQFLVWLHKKTASLGSPYQESALRAFYCDVVEGIMNDHYSQNSENASVTIYREISRMLDSKIDKDIDDIREIANQLMESKYNGIPFREGYNKKFSPREIICLIDQVIKSPTVDIVIERNLAIECKRKNKRGMIYLLQATALLVRETDKDFQRTMRGFINIFEDQKTRGVHLYEKNIEDLNQQLISCLYRERNLKLDWQFSDEQKQLLNNYYAANKLLLDCLRESNASPEVQKEMQDTLLLPIVEVERRKSGIIKKLLLDCPQESNAYSEVKKNQETLLPKAEIEKRNSNEVQQSVQKTLPLLTEPLPTDEVARHNREKKQSKHKLSVKTNFYTTTLFYSSLLIALILYIVFIIVLLSFNGYDIHWTGKKPLQVIVFLMT